MSISYMEDLLANIDVIIDNMDRISDTLLPVYENSGAEGERKMECVARDFDAAVKSFGDLAAMKHSINVLQGYHI